MNTTKHFPKIIIAFLMLGFYTSSTSAQFLQVGPKLGISSSKVQVDEKFNYQGNEINYESGDATLGFHAGAFARVSIVSFYLQPELLFSSVGGNIVVNEETSTGVVSDVREMKYNQVQIPLMFGKSFGKFFRIQVGPTFCFLLSDDARDVQLRNELEQRYNDATVGYQAGIGLDIGSLIIDLKYEGNLSKLGSSVSFAGESFETDLRTSQFVLSVGFNLL